METLSDELLGAVASFLSSLNDLKTLALTNKRFNNLVTSSQEGERIFRALYHQRYPRAQHHGVPGWQLWRDVHDIHRLITKTSAPTRSSSRRRPRRPILHSTCNLNAVEDLELNTLLVMAPELEAEAIYYDHHNAPDDSVSYSSGYFGLQPLMPTSNNLQPVAILGDFQGLKIAPCAEALLDPDSVHRDQLKTLIDEYGSQVMDVKVHPHPEAHKSCSSPFFVGFASGVVMAAAYKDGALTTLSASGAIDNSGLPSEQWDELPSLAILPSLHKGSLGTLVASWVRGKIWLYPNALDKLSLEGGVCLNESDFPMDRIHNPTVHGISATLLANNKAVLCLCGDGLKISLWELAPSSQSKQHVEILERREVRYRPSNHEDGEQWGHMAQLVSFVGPVADSTLFASQRSSFSGLCHGTIDTLVVGTSYGYVMTYDLRNDGQLHLRSAHERLHNGAVESVERSGDLLFTGGGKDGTIKVLDLVRGVCLKNILVHPGRRLPGASERTRRPLFKAGVMTSWVCHERQSIVGFCRDGQIAEVSFRTRSAQSENANVAASDTSGDDEKKRPGSRELQAGGKRKRQAPSS